MRILVLVPGSLGEQMTGPEMRAWELARSLSREHEVTAAARGPQQAARDGVRLIEWSRRRLLREALRSDAVVSHCLPPYLLATKAVRQLVAVSDQYDPIELELATLTDKRYARCELRSAKAIRRLQLRFADVVLCAGERQQEALVGELRALGQMHTPLVVPFGIAPEPPASRRRPLRDRFGISDDETVALWWGSIWRWFDAPTAIRAAGLAARSRADLRLVITAGRPPRAELDRFTAIDEARTLAGRLGLLDRVVFFLDDWISFDERHEWLADADLGLTLHRNTPEAKLAARARYMDYLWAGLPCVLGRGDDVAERFGAARFASLVNGGDPAATAVALLALADPATRSQARAAGAQLAEAMRWPATTAPLVDALREMPAVERATNLGLLSGAGSYYARQALNRILPV